MLLTALASLPLSLSLPPQTAEVQKLFAGSPSASDFFGIAVAASGSRVLVGAHQDDPLASNSGAAYVVALQADGSWVEEDQLVPGDGASADNFGRAVALDGERALVAAYRDDGPAGVDQGSAYVFERQGDGSWLEVDKLVPGAAAFDEAGYAVALAGNYAALGSYRNDDAATDAGKVWVFERQGDGTWIEVIDLVASDAGDGDNFGWSLALSGETLLVGAILEGPPGFGGGAAYVFERQGGTWSEVTKLKPADVQALDYFGWSVALDGDRAVVGSYNAESAGEPFGWDEGAAYTFERQGAAWLETGRLEALDADGEAEFGYAVALDGERLVVGAWNDDGAAAPDAGAAYVYELDSGGSWVETAKLEPQDGAAGDLFGRAVGLAGDVVLAGASNDDDFGSSSGSAYVFDVEPLSGTPAVLSVAAGGTQTLQLDAGQAHAAELYWLLGTSSGTTPGFPIGPGLVLPLNVDAYFLITVNHPNQPPLTGSFASLNAAGHAEASFTLPPGSNPGLAGLTLHHAFGAIDPVSLTATFTSNALALTLLP